MALRCFRIFHISLIFLALSLSFCSKKETDPGSNNNNNSTQNPEPTQTAAKIEGRIEFAKASNSFIRGSSKNHSPVFSNRIIVKFKNLNAAGAYKDMIQKMQVSLENQITDESQIAKVKNIVGNVVQSNDVKNSFVFLSLGDKTKQLTPDEINLVVNELSKNPNIAYASAEYTRSWQVLAYNDKFFYKQWNLNLPNFLNFADDGWDPFFSQPKQIRVAVVDTGYRPHKDLDGIFRKDLGYDFVSDMTLSLDGDGIDSDPTDIGSPTGAAFFHGTFVAGIIAAKRDNNDEGIVGIAPNVAIIPVRVLGKDGSGTDFDIAQGIRYAAGLSNSSPKILSKDEKADVINLSLGGPGEAPIIHDAIKDAVSAGVVVVCAAGNENTNVPSYPASYDECISVGALNPSKEGEPYTKAEYSNYDINVDIMAPGGSVQYDEPIDPAPAEFVPQGITSASWNNGVNVGGKFIDCRPPTADFPECSGYSAYSGTSFAAPHISAIAALMKSANNSLTPAGIASILFRTANNEDGNRLGFGHGIVNALDALDEAKNKAAVKDKIIVKLINLKDPDNLAVSKTVEITNSSDFSFIMDGVESGNYVIHAGTDYNGNGIIYENGEKFGIYPSPQDGVMFTLKDGEDKKDITVVLTRVKDPQKCPKGECK